jgi:uncharacterized protein (DUF2384 family)
MKTATELTAVSLPPVPPGIVLADYRSFVARAVDVFGDEIKASLWLSTPSADLQGKIPLQIAQELHFATADVETIFEPIFVRIEHGIYS